MSDEDTMNKLDAIAHTLTKRDRAPGASVDREAMSDGEYRHAAINRLTVICWMLVLMVASSAVYTTYYVIRTEQALDAAGEAVEQAREVSDDYGF